MSPLSSWMMSRRWINRSENNASFKSLIESMWESGELPIQDGKQWIVGYRVHIAFHCQSAYPITVGPGRPARFRRHYAICENAKRPWG